MQGEASGGFSLQCETNDKYRILVVNDDADICRLNVDGLRRNGYEVGIAGDGYAGWLELQTNCYNLLITENELPGMSGVGLVKKLRLANMPIPVIIAIKTMPTWQSPQYPWLLRASKLYKPYTIVALLGLVRDVLRSANDATINVHQSQIRPPDGSRWVPTNEIRHAFSSQQ